MPELPEVQTIINGLNQYVIGLNLSAILEKRKGTIIWSGGANICELGSISKISRRGKYIIIYTSSRLKIIVHLRMTGKLIYEDNLAETSAHSRAEMIFSNNTKIIFDDVRTFGKIWIMNEDDEFEPFTRLGVEPLNAEFNFEYLKTKMNRTRAIKNIILDQNIIAGLGNIYACEILYRAKINPKKAGKDLTNKQIHLLVEETKIVLTEAIKHNGTTISDYRSVEDKSGEFQNFLNVYQKQYCKCNEKISKIKQAGRSTYYCKACQK